MGMSGTIGDLLVEKAKRRDINNTVPADLIYVAFSDGARHFGVLEPDTSRYVAVLRLGYMSAGKWQVGAEDRVLYIPVESIQWVEPHVGSLS